VSLAPAAGSGGAAQGCVFAKALLAQAAHCACAEQRALRERRHYDRVDARHAGAWW
jgi:hypothetical protein